MRGTRNPLPRDGPAAPQISEAGVRHLRRPPLQRADLAHVAAPMTPKAAGRNAEAPFPRNPGLCRIRGTDPLSKFAGLGVARPALEETRYFPPIVVGDAE